MSDGRPDDSRGREPRSVPARRALAWYADAMRLWKRGPATFAGLAFVTIALTILLEPVPVAGFVASNLVAPLVAAGMLYASLAADRGDAPSMRHALAAFSAGPVAQVTVILSGLVAFAAEAWAAWRLAGINLLLPTGNASDLPLPVIAAIYAAGILASLPMTFVPFAALFEGRGMREAFATSARAFARNVPPLLLYAAISFVLLFLGLTTFGVGLVLVLPWMAAASYAAWKDIYGLDVPPRS
jgi:uncharacterized membrane protein